MRHTILLSVLATAFAAQATLYRAGLKGGFINAHDGSTYTTADIPDIGVFASVEAGGVKADASSSKDYPPVWANNRTWRYHGQMYFDGGTYYFAESCDDVAWMAVDGTQVLKDSTWNNVGVSSTVAPAAGWHDVEIRFGNGGSGAGVPYDTVLDANGRLCGFGVVRYATTPETRPSAMSEFTFAENTDGNVWMRCAESYGYITVNSIAQTANGFRLSVTSAAPVPVTATVYAGATAGEPESATGWDCDSGEIAFAANETKSIDITGPIGDAPRFVVYLAGTGTTLEEGVGVPFWEWSDIVSYTMGPTLDVGLLSKTASGAMFDVSLGYDKIIADMTPPPFELVAYYGARDAGPQTAGWDGSVSFGSAIAAGSSSRTLADLPPDAYSVVRFAARTPGSDWVWSDSIRFWTSDAPFNSRHWRFSAPVSFPGYTLDGALENFPVLVRLRESEDGFSYEGTSADGSDLRFAVEDGPVLPSEVALWNPQGESLVWVTVPLLDAGVAIRMYWGGEHEFPQSQTDGSVWTTAGYFAVWHMDEGADSTIAKDSAGGALDGTHYGTSPGEDGIAGRSVRISSGGWNVADDKGISTASYTGVGNTFMVSFWTKYPNQNPGTDRFISKKAYYSDANGWELSTMRYNQSQVDFRGSGPASVEPPVSIKNTSWQHLAFVYKGGTGTAYLNNEWKKNGSIAPVVDNDVVLTIGNTPGPDGVPKGDSLKGWMDEVRIYRGEPPRDWISTEYNSVHDTAFAVVGSRETLPDRSETVLILL